MVSIAAIKKILKEEGISKLVINSINNLKSRLAFNKALFRLRLIRLSPLKPLPYYANKIHNTKPAAVYVVVCIDAEGPNKFGDNTNWGKIMKEFDKLFKKRQDIKISFFVADWMSGADKHGYTDVGHHKIFDRYKKFKNIYWHYHPPSNNHKKPVVDWIENGYHEDIINRKIIDRKYFPSLFRAGFTYEGPKAKKWLNRWIPLDFSSRAPYTYWEKSLHSVDRWAPYYEGNRQIFRSLDAENIKWSNLAEVEAAFISAAGGGNTILSFFTHDYKDFIKHIGYIDSMIQLVSKKYPHIPHHYSPALTAIRKVIKGQKYTSLHIKINKRNKYKLIIKTNKVIYQKYPYIVVKHNSHYIHDENIKKIDDTTWEFSIKGKFDKIGVAASDRFGYSKVRVINYESFNNKSNNQGE